MGKTLFYLTQFDKATEYLSNALRMYLTDTEADAVESTEPLLYLGRLNFKNGETKKVINHMERAYNLRKDNLGEDSIITLEAINFFLQFLLVNRQNKDVQAKLLVNLLQRQRRNKQKNQIQVVKPYKSSDFTSQKYKEYDDALKNYEIAKEIYLKVLGENSL